MADEEVLFDSGRVRVTTHRATLFGTMFPIAALTSVRTIAKTDSPVLVVFGTLVVCLALLFGGLGWMGSNPSQAGWSLAIGLAGLVVLLLGGRTNHMVIVSTAGGDRNALVTRNQSFAYPVRQAIETAIVRRG